MAFNVDCPRHYLDPESLAGFMQVDQVGWCIPVLFACIHSHAHTHAHIEPAAPSVHCVTIHIVHAYSHTQDVRKLTANRRQIKAESYCLGKIVQKKERVANEDDCESYGVAPGETFWVCAAVPLAPR
jgi:hypothetical protein